MVSSNGCSVSIGRNTDSSNPGLSPIAFYLRAVLVVGGRPSIGPAITLIGVRKARFRASLPSEPDRRVSRIRLASRWFTAERSDERLAGAVWRAPFQRSELTLPSPQSRGVITMNLDLHRTLSV